MRKQTCNIWKWAITNAPVAATSAIATSSLDALTLKLRNASPASRETEERITSRTIGSRKTSSPRAAGVIWLLEHLKAQKVQS